MISGRIGFRIAGLGLLLDASGSDIELSLPASRAQFLSDVAEEEALVLHVRDESPPGPAGRRSVFYDKGTWELWRDEAGRYVFVVPEESLPRRQFTIDADFRQGELFGEFCARGGPERAIDPLRDFDMVIFSNWLASYGDLMVHAAGIDDSGAGYAFVGPSGAGKSTLAGLLASDASVTVLGEDQVILRQIDGGFLLYGTPWHKSPAMCSPGGVPLRKLFFLDRAAQEGVRPCGPAPAIERLLQDAFIPYYDRAGVARILDTLSRLAGQVAFYTLSYRLGAEVPALLGQIRADGSGGTQPAAAQV